MEIEKDHEGDFQIKTDYDEHNLIRDVLYQRYIKALSNLDDMAYEELRTIERFIKKTSSVPLPILINPKHLTHIANGLEHEIETLPQKKAEDVGVLVTHMRAEIIALDINLEFPNIHPFDSD